MTERDEVLSALKREVMNVKARFGVRRMGLYGSVVRDEAGDQSDIDIPIELDLESVSYQKYLDLEQYLQSLFSRRVDIVTTDGVSKYILPYISREHVILTPDIIRFAETLWQNGVDTYDALHYACALSAGAAFVTVDDAQKNYECLTGDQIYTAWFIVENRGLFNFLYTTFAGQRNDGRAFDPTSLSYAGVGKGGGATTSLS